MLVTGAAGNTGREIVKRLADGGAGVCGRVRKVPDHGPDAWSGVEFITANFDDSASIRRALEGVERAFLVANSSGCVEEQQLEFVEIARAAGLRRIVYLSQLHADVRSPVRFLRYHAVAEEAISWSGIAFRHLCPNFFMQCLLGFRSSIGIVDVRDIAAIAAALTGNEHQGKTYDITGPEALTHARMACQFTTVLGEPVTFVDVSEAAMREAFLGFGFAEWQADGSAVSSSVQEITGRSAGCFAAFARDHKDAFSC